MKVKNLIWKRALSDKELARELGTCLSTTFQIPADKVVADSRDGAAVNGAALRQLRDLLYPKLLDLVCLSHSLDNVGAWFRTPTLDNFTQWWVSLFARSPAARIAWKTRTGTNVKSNSRTRW